MPKMDPYTAIAKLQLDALNTRMDDLDAQGRDASEDAREKYKAEMIKLRHQSKLAVAKLDDLKAASKGFWGKMGTVSRAIRLRIRKLQFTYRDGPGGDGLS
jgi:hypothetical protein